MLLQQEDGYNFVSCRRVSSFKTLYELLCYPRLSLFAEIPAMQGHVIDDLIHDLHKWHFGPLVSLCMCVCNELVHEIQVYIVVFKLFQGGKPDDILAVDQASGKLGLSACRRSGKGIAGKVAWYCRP
uniref:Uncharacterized protein n=1 Tax=Curvibacter symbiont subsp. Hydra magnipapillata TaxID=667019 RepID=C9Y935_CURXX|nr:hypothetical protein Csp_A06360 [Curvibacter putative symbiont of Hydra magnipapillata]